MTAVLKIGKLFKPNSTGNLVNEASIEKIKAPWKEAVEAVKESYVRNLRDSLQSIYVRGTVARGEAIEGVSDLDTTALVSGETNLEPRWFQVEQSSLKSHFPFVSKFEFSLMPVEELEDSSKRVSQKFFLKTQSVCVYGEDVSKQLPEFKITADLAQCFYKNLQADIEKAKERISRVTRPAQVQNWCRWIAKRILRAGFALVMAREQAYTRDLYPSYEVFSKYYPEKEREMKNILELAINPIDDKSKILEMLNSFGSWLATETTNQSG